jgi:hypothetical protein
MRKNENYHYDNPLPCCTFEMFLWFFRVRTITSGLNVINRRKIVVIIWKTQTSSNYPDFFDGTIFPFRWESAIIVAGSLAKHGRSPPSLPHPLFQRTPCGGCGRTTRMTSEAQSNDNYSLENRKAVRCQSVSLPTKLLYCSRRSLKPNTKQ